MIKHYDDDIILDETIIKAQYEIAEMGSVLTDYINHGVNNVNHIVLVDRRAEEFFHDFSSKGAVFIELINTIRVCLSKKAYKNEHLAAKVFAEEIKCNEYFIYNINVIELCIKDYVKIISSYSECDDTDFYVHPLLKGKIAFMDEMLYDISEFLEKLYIVKSNYYKNALAEGVVTEKNTLFVTKNRPTRFKRKKSTALEIYQNVRNSMDRYCCYDSICDVPTAMFQIRQAIEIRIWEIFGIKYIGNDTGGLVKITAEALLGMDGLDKGLDFHIKLSNLLLIHKWTNIYIHVGIAEKYWLIYFAAECIKEFVVSKAVANDDYYTTLNDRLEKYVCKNGEHIEWLKEKACISKSQLAEQKAFDERLLNQLEGK